MNQTQASWTLYDFSEKHTQQIKNVSKECHVCRCKARQAVICTGFIEIKAIEYLNEWPNNYDVEHICGICSEKLSDNNGCEIDCQHCICHNCLKKLLHSCQEIDSENFITNLSSSKNDEHAMSSICSEWLPSKIKSKLREFEMHYLIESCAKLAKCPNCDLILEVEISDSKNPDIECPCEFYFCKLCQSEAHQPLDCVKYADWKNSTFEIEEQLNEICIQRAKFQREEGYIPLDQLFASLQDLGPYWRNYEKNRKLAEETRKKKEGNVAQCR